MPSDQKENAKEKEEDSVCAKCAGKHDTRVCTSTVTKCPNCTKAGHESNLDHPAYAPNCPTYIAEQNKVKDTINYYTAKNPTTQSRY